MRVVRDRRSSLRVEIDGEAVVHADRDVIEGRCVDLGRDGLAIRSTRATRSKHPVSLVLYLGGPPLRVDAVLARRQRLHGDYIMGFAFVHLDAGTRSRIERAIFDQLARSPEAELLLAFAAHVARPTHAPPFEGRIYDRADRTVVAAAGLIVPVVSGHTQVIAMDRLPPDRTVIAPPPPRSETVRLGSDPVAFEDSWFEDEMDTAEFYLLEATVEPELEPELALEPEHTVVASAPAPAPKPKPTPEHTVVVGAPAALPRPEPTVVTGTPAPGPTLDPGEAERTIPVAPFAPAATPDLSEQPWRVEKTFVLATDGLVGVPETIAPTHTTTMAAAFELDSPAVVAPEHTVPMVIEHPSPPPLLRGGAGRRPPTTSDTSAPLTPIMRYSQQALQRAIALLHGIHDPPPRRGPHVIVSIPHRTYRRRTASTWNG